MFYFQLILHASVLDKILLSIMNTSHTHYSFQHERVIFKYVNKIVVNAMQCYYL